MVIDTRSNVDVQGVILLSWNSLSRLGTLTQKLCRIRPSAFDYVIVSVSYFVIESRQKNYVQLGLLHLMYVGMPYFVKTIIFGSVGL